MSTAQQPRYRVTVHELDGNIQTLVMDAEGDGFHAAVGTLHHGRLQGDHGVAGPPHLLQHLADLINDNPTGTPR